MAKKQQKQTIIFDKQISGNRQKADVSSQVSSQKTASPPAADNDVIEVDIAKVGEFILLAIIILLGFAVAAVAIIDVFTPDTTPTANQEGSVNAEDNVANENGNESQGNTDSSETEPTGQQNNEGSVANPDQSTPEDSTEQTNVEGGEGDVGVSPTAVEKPNPNDSGNINSDGGNSGVSTVRTYTYAAARGEGVVHLSRRAMLEHLKLNNVELNAAQKLYFETNLSVLSNPKPLAVGESRVFGQDRLDRLMREAQNLSSAQQQQWHKYLAGYPLR